MKSLLNLFRVGPGPSSSHTIAPKLGAEAFMQFCEEELKSQNCVPYNSHFEVILSGSLAFTGEGHGTLKAIRDVFFPFETKFSFNTEEDGNFFRISLVKDGEVLKKAKYFSRGGGELYSEEDTKVIEEELYNFKNFKDIKYFLAKNNIQTWREFVHICERNPNIDEKSEELLRYMFDSVERGLNTSGKLHANDNPRLQLNRVSKFINEDTNYIDGLERDYMLMTSYAYAVSEESACGGIIVTSPTCGSSGVLPAVLYHYYHDLHYPMKKILEAFYAAGVIGNVVKQNASISGAAGGCQAEIGTASAMTAIALACLNDLTLYQQEYAAECALEHFLGLSCDPVDGYVLIPCIERNGIAVIHSYGAYLYAKYISKYRYNMISFDDAVEAMKDTGDGLPCQYKETSQGGLAKICNKK